MWKYIYLVACLLASVALPHQTANCFPSANFRNYSSPDFRNGGARMINSPVQVDNQMLNKWISTSLKFFDFSRCITSHIASSEDECFKLNEIPRSEIAVYFATGQNGGIASSAATMNGKRENMLKRSQRVVAVLPDSTTPKAGGAHDAVLVLDPYPNANFGHLVAVFYIDLGIDSKKCKDDHQIFTTDETCITVAKKSRCPNRLEKYTGGGLQPRRCHIDFLPSVYYAEPSTTGLSSHGFNNADGSGTQPSHDLLNCINIPGFANCPTFRPLDDTRRVLCDASAENSKRCDTSHTGVGTRCKLFQTCDQAVLIGGGWNRMHSSMKSFHNIIKVQNSLSSIGFLPENIKTFYANGKNRKPQVGRNGRSMYDESSYFSSVMKTGLRGHLRTMCELRHCADSLFIYLNNPTTIEGDMLLWDADYNGMVDELEVYTVKEFLSDILGCEARRVVIVADQSNSEVILSNLKESVEHKNVLLYAAGLPNQVTTNGELTELWANHSESSTCIKHVYQHVVNGMSASNSTYVDTTSGISEKVSIIGAPCDLLPPVSSRELKTLYEGCQNVPTSVWFSAFEDYDSNGGGDESDENSPNGRRS